MSVTHEIMVRFDENPAILGAMADRAAAQLGILSFAEFQKQRSTQHFSPQRAILAIYDGPNEEKRRVFDIVNQEKKIAHQKEVVVYERNKRQYDLLNIYPDNLAGYGTYLICHCPQVMAFLGKQRPFSIDEESRRLHSYITGGSGSGKSECLKSLVWHYLTKDTSSALVFIDPHNDVAKQVAQFQPNRGNGRLVYVEPRMNDRVFPGLNPFDIDGKENFSDAEAESYADEFIHAFHEILAGNLTDQMENLLKNTIPVLIKMPDSSVYDLIKFLTPKPSKEKSRKANTEQPEKPEEYAAQKYVDFANANFENTEMLDFLSGQFEYDSGYITTRNALTTRLRGIFGGTLMQALFQGKRTVRIEDLIAQKKLIVFNLAKLKRGTGTIGRFILITLKIFALNQAEIAKSQRTPCHVFVDECQKFVTESMSELLEEARKFYVFLTLAQQSAGGKMPQSLFESVRTNTAVKMAGVNNGLTLDIVAKETGVPVETIAGFTKGQFALFQREAPQKIAIVRMPTNTLDDSASMTPAEWQALRKEQIRLYYRAPHQGAGKPADSPAAANPLSVNIDAHLN